MGGGGGGALARLVRVAGVRAGEVEQRQRVVDPHTDANVQMRERRDLQ